VRDIGADFAAALKAFRAALIAVEAKGKDAKGMGLYGVAMAAGGPVLGGFAPPVGVAAPPAGRKSRLAGSVGESRFAVARWAGVQVDTEVPAARQRGRAQTSYRAVVAQARSQAEIGQARREAEGAVLHLPGRGAVLAGLSFVPRPDVGAAKGHLLRPGRVGGSVSAGFWRRGSVHSAVLAAEASFADNGKAGSGPAGNGRADIREAGDEQFTAAAAPAPPVVTPADIERALESYFFRQSRLPPTGGAGFNPMLSPVWAGLKIPG
jgi:hypothetical protein